MLLTERVNVPASPRADTPISTVDSQLFLGFRGRLLCIIRVGTKLASS